MALARTPEAPAQRQRNRPPAASPGCRWSPASCCLPMSCSGSTPTRGLPITTGSSPPPPRPVVASPRRPARVGGECLPGSGSLAVTWHAHHQRPLKSQTPSTVPPTCTVPCRENPLLSWDTPSAVHPLVVQMHNYRYFKTCMHGNRIASRECVGSKHLGGGGEVRRRCLVSKNKSVPHPGSVTCWEFTGSLCSYQSCKAWISRTVRWDFVQPPA